MGLTKIFDIAYSSTIFLTSLVTQDNDTWLFGSQGGYSYADNSKYFFEWMLANKQQETCFWVTKDKAIYRDLLAKGVPVLYFYDLTNLVAFAKAKYIVSTHSHTGNDVYKFIHKRKVLVTLWHGIPLKKMGGAPRRSYLEYLKVKNSPDLFLVTSKRDANLFSKIYHVSIDKFYVGTYPRINNLVSIAKKKKTVLYAPTFRDGMGQDYYDKYVFPSTHELQQLNKLLINFEYEFLIKMHPYVNATFPDLTHYSNINTISAFEDVQEPLSKAAILITDYSSIYFDYLNLDREMIFFIPDFEWYYNKSNRGLLYDYEEVTPGHKTTSWSEVQERLKEIFESPTYSVFAGSRNNIRNHFFAKKNVDNTDLFNLCKSIK